MANNATISIYGRVIKDPVTRATPKGDVLTFPVAVNTSIRKTDGTYESNYYDVSVWGKMIEYLQRDLVKGTLVTVVGDFCAQAYETKDGGSRQGLRINANRVNFEARKAANNSSVDNEIPF